VPLRIGKVSQTGADRLAIEMNGAGATEFGSGEPDDAANHPQKRHLRVGIDNVLDAIDLDLWHRLSRPCYGNAAHFWSVLR
jgi:hypothetical protein